MGASRYWSSGPVPAAEGPPAAGAVGVVGGCDAGADEVGGAEADVDGTGEAGAEVVAEGCGLLDVAGAAAADRESWWRPSITAKPVPEMASTTTTMTAAIRMNDRDLVGPVGSGGGMYGGPM